MNTARIILTYLAIAAMPLAAQPAVALVTPSASPAHMDERALQSAVRQIFRAQNTQFPYYRNVGILNQSTGIYMGNGYVLTAAHVGAGTFHLGDGTRYSPVPGSEQMFRNRDGSFADLCVFKIAFSRRDSVANLPAIPMGPVRPGRGSYVMLVGGGSGNAHPGGGQAAESFRWNNDYRIRWGLNRVEQEFSGPMQTDTYFTPGYATRFSPGHIECQATPGDSGGAVFAYNGVDNRWELAGVILAVDSPHGRAEYGNQTYCADITIIPRGTFGNTRGIFASR